MNFGNALEAAKAGKRIARAGWNGKNMFVYLNRGSAAPDNHSGTIGSLILIGGILRALYDVGDKDTVTRAPNLNLKAADGTIVTGWLASQTDLLAEDWKIAE